MADGFDIHLGPEQASHLRAAAEAKGLDPEIYVKGLLEEALERDNPGYIVRTRLAEYDRTGEYVPVEEALTAFDRALKDRLAARK